MSRSRSVSAVAALLCLSSLALTGCSLFSDSKKGSPTTLPAQTSATAAATSTGASPSVSISALPVTAPTPPPVPGYTLAPAPTTVVRTFQTVAGKFSGVFGGLTVRNVTKGTDVTGTVVLLGLHPELVGNPTVESGLLPGMIKGMAGQGAKTSTQKINGMDVATATTKTTNIVAWYKDGTVVLVLGNGADATPTLAFAKAYLSAGH